MLLRDDMEPDAVHAEHICGNLHISSHSAGHYTGILIKESLAEENILDDLMIHKAELWRTNGMPRYWTALYFSSDVLDFPQHLSRAILPPQSETGTWFCDFRADSTKYIVFHKKILTYRIGDTEGRARIVQECGKLGIPIEQTHWED